MDSVRRVFATYLVDRVDASSPASTSSSHGFPLVPRRLSTSFARATTSPGVSSIARRVLDASEIAARAIGLKRGRETPSSGRASPSLLGGELKRARGERALDVSVVQNEINVEDEDVTPWPSAKRKRASSEVDEEDAPSAHRLRTSEVSDGRAATYATSKRRLDAAPKQPQLLVERVLKNGRLDGFKNLPKMSSRVTVVPRRGKPSRRGVPYRGPSRGLGTGVEFEELPEDRAERERLEASKAPVLGTSTSSALAFPSAPATLSSKPKEGSSSIVGAALAEFKSTVTSTSDAKTEPPKEPTPTPSTKAPAFVFGSTPAPAASAPITNPFAAPLAGAEIANPFAGFTAGAPASAPANGERRIVRARRPASRNR